MALNIGSQAVASGGSISQAVDIGGEQVKSEVLIGVRVRLFKPSA